MPSTGLVAWWDEPAPGPENMAADEVLAAEAAEAGRLLVRLYGWSEPTVSLGGFQRLADARACPAIAGLPLVRRPSGGGAIVHGSDLTYAVAVPRDHPWGRDPQILYDVFHAALVRLLQRLGVAASQHAGRGREAGDEERLLCFDRRARGDVVVDGGAAGDDGHKILGSAQRRLRGAVLQHGSLLLRKPGRVAEQAAHPGLFDLEASLEPHDPQWLAREWLALAAGSAANLEVRPESFSSERAAAITAAAGRFQASTWLGRR